MNQDTASVNMVIELQAQKSENFLTKRETINCSKKDLYRRVSSVIKVLTTSAVLTLCDQLDKTSLHRWEYRQSVM
jgi:hypothetical protein